MRTSIAEKNLPEMRADTATDRLNDQQSLDLTYGAAPCLLDAAIRCSYDFKPFGMQSVC